MQKNQQWHPNASIELLRKRAQLLQKIRNFFATENVLEVETPLLCQHTVTDPYIDSFSVATTDHTRYLQTSPEYAMKRLLAAGSGSIYQICKAFRNEQPSTQHNPEFTILEWYRVGWDATKLMQETEKLLNTLSKCPPAQYITYQNVFKNILQIDPLTISETELQELVRHKTANTVSNAWLNAGKDALLSDCFNRWIEPTFAKDTPVFVTEFPATQAALAQLNQTDNRVADRFELYFRGYELANGFAELTDETQQRARFINDQTTRKQQQSKIPNIDERLLAALANGLPTCAGVALGVDRLLMAITATTDINTCLSFSWEKS